MTEDLGGAKVHAVTSGTATLKDAVSEMMREWTNRIADTHYVLGSAMGPHPFPTIVCDFQAVISKEIKEQMLEKEGRLPDAETRTVQQSHVTEGRISMNKNIKKAFEKGKAFIPFITCGDPSLEVTERIVYAMEEAGADLIELGIPFSDPTAEGPVIQAANVRALSGGVTTDKIFDMVRRIRQKTSIPMVFMTYANVVYSYGTERFAKAAAEIGMDGLILPDVPFEEKEEFAIPFKEHGRDLISLIAPTSRERIAMIAKEAEGFGISEPKQTKKMVAQSDGVIVGSAIVKLCEKYGADCVPHISTFVKEMKDAIR